MQMTEENSSEIEITCQNCGHEWNYKGEKEYPAMTNCPSCMNKVRIPKNNTKTKNDEKEG